jgi:hypothetical protein
MQVSSHTTHCTICNVKLIGKQTKYCSRNCKNKDTNHHYNSYIKQQERGLKRKILLLNKSGNKCSKCGYNKCTASLSFHHTNPKEKSFGLDLRALSNRTWSKIEAEFKKCELLCLNCHAELHYKQYH